MVQTLKFFSYISQTESFFVKIAIINFARKGILVSDIEEIMVMWKNFFYVLLIECDTEKEINHMTSMRNQ